MSCGLELDNEASGVWGRVGALVSSRPRAVWVSTALVIGVCALGVAAFNTPQQTMFRTEPDSAHGQALVAAHYPAGASNPVDIIAPTDRGDAVKAAAMAAAGVRRVDEVARADGRTVFQATLDAAPDSNAEYESIERLRRQLDPFNALVGGRSATNLDLRTANVRDAQLVIPLVLAAILLVLCALLRSIIAALLVISTVVLSFAAALGLSVVIFEGMFGWHGQDAALPIQAFVFLVALGVDYNIFLMSRVREEAERIGTRAGAVRALVLTGGVITSAG